MVSDINILSGYFVLKCFKILNILFGDVHPDIIVYINNYYIDRLAFEETDFTSHFIYNLTDGYDQYFTSIRLFKNILINYGYGNKADIIEFSKSHINILCFFITPFEELIIDII